MSKLTKEEGRRGKMRKDTRSDRDRERERERERVREDVEKERINGSLRRELS